MLSKVPNEEWCEKHICMCIMQSQSLARKPWHAYYKSLPLQWCRKESDKKESKGKLCQNHGASTGAAAVGQKACLRMKRHLSSEGIKFVALSIVALYLHHLVSQLVNYFVQYTQFWRQDQQVPGQQQHSQEDQKRYIQSLT